jgi:hypothetical protein
MATTAVAGACLALLLGGLSLLLLGIVSACCGPVAAESILSVFWLGVQRQKWLWRQRTRLYDTAGRLNEPLGRIYRKGPSTYGNHPMYYVHEWFSHTYLILGKVEGLFEKYYFALSWDSRWVLGLDLAMLIIAEQEIVEKDRPRRIS